MSDERYQLVIRGEPGFRGNMTARLKVFLKVALRQFGLRCVSIRPVTASDADEWLDPRPKATTRQGGR